MMVPFRGRIDTAGEKRLAIALAFTLVIAIVTFILIKMDEQFIREFLTDLLAGVVAITIFTALLLMYGVKRP